MNSEEEKYRVGCILQGRLDRVIFLGRLRDSKWGEKLEGRWEEM